MRSCSCAKSLTCVWLFVTSWIVALQALLSVGILQARILEWVAMLYFRGITILFPTQGLNLWCLPCGSAGKESTYNLGDLGSFPGLGRSPGKGKGYPLQYSGLENSMDFIVHGVTESHTTEQLSLSLSLSLLLLHCRQSFYHLSHQGSQNSSVIVRHIMDTKELCLSVSTNFCSVTSPINRWSVFTPWPQAFTWLSRWIQNMGEKRNYPTKPSRRIIRVRIFKTTSLGMVCYAAKSNWNIVYRGLSIIS